MCPIFSCVKYRTLLLTSAEKVASLLQQTAAPTSTVFQGHTHYTEFTERINVLNHTRYVTHETICNSTLRNMRSTKLPSQTTLIQETFHLPGNDSASMHRRAATFICLLVIG